MDMNELKRRERWAELAASIAQADRNIEAKARRHRTLRFWFSPWQVADEPVAAVPTPGAQAPNAPLGVGSGEAGSEPTSQPPVTTQGPGGARRFVGPAGPNPNVRPAGAGPATPHLDASLASRISARITQT